MQFSRCVCSLLTVGYSYRRCYVLLIRSYKLTLKIQCCYIHRCCVVTLNAAYRCLVLSQNRYCRICEDLDLQQVQCLNWRGKLRWNDNFTWDWKVIWVFLINPIHKIQEKRGAKWNLNATIWNLVEIHCGTYLYVWKRVGSKQCRFS